MVAGAGGVVRARRSRLGDVSMRATAHSGQRLLGTQLAGASFARGCRCACVQIDIHLYESTSARIDICTGRGHT